MATNLTWVTCICGKLHIVQRFPAQCPTCETIMDIEYVKNKRNKLKPVIVLSGEDFSKVKKYLIEDSPEGPLIDFNRFEYATIDYADGRFKLGLKTTKRSTNGQDNIR